MPCRHDSRPVALARAGLHVLTCGSRYAGNDSVLTMEKCCKDLGSVLSHCRDQLKYEKVVLCGWSGGGSLSVFYQSQATIPAEHRVATPVDLSQATLPPADAMLIMVSMLACREFCSCASSATVCSHRQAVPPPQSI